MKRKILMLVLMAFSMVGFAQESAKAVGGYGGPLIEAANINGDWGILIGGKGGAVFSERFAFGGIGMALVGSNEFIGDDLMENMNAALDLEYGAGGIFVEYLIKSNGPIRFSIPVNVMGGGVRVNSVSSETEIESTGFFMLEPGINLEIKATESFTPSINISYRQAFGVSLVNLDNQAISGLNIGLIFKFGKY